MKVTNFLRTVALPIAAIDDPESHPVKARAARTLRIFAACSLTTSLTLITVWLAQQVSTDNSVVDGRPMV